MMMRDSTGPVGESEVAAFEAELGASLPASYREFLIEYGGGRPDPDAFDYKDGSEGSSVALFYYMDGDTKNYDSLRNIRRTFAKAIPDSLLVIGHDPGGNQICVGISGDVRGNVIFWDHEFGDVDDLRTAIDEGGLRLIADDFREFLDGLFEFSL